MTLLEQCQSWHEANEFTKIIEALEALPAEQRTPETDSELARAYNNAADLGQRDYYERAIELLKPHAEHFEGDHLWNFRMGYAYYYLDQEGRALPYFEAALAALPGDADTEQLIEACRERITLPLFARPFRTRVTEAWSAFEEAEADLRALMDGEDQGEEMIARCGDILHIAFDDVSFEMGKGTEKYELILSPEGERCKLFALVYFARQAPASVLEHWNIRAGRAASAGFALRAKEDSVEAKDVTVYFERAEESEVTLTFYCEKLLPLLQRDENRVWWMLTLLLDQTLGEIAAMRLLHDLDIVDTPQEGASVTLAELPDALRAEGLSLANDAEEYLDNAYLAYEREPDTGSELTWRDDIYTGLIRLPSAISTYLSGDPKLVDDYHADGIVAGFIAYPLMGALDGDAQAILDFRDDLITAVTKAADGDAFCLLGAATGTEVCYLDFLAWDAQAVLDAAKAHLEQSELPWAVFHSFRRDARPVTLFDRTEDESEKNAGTPAKSLLSPAAVRKLEAMDEGSSGYFYKMLNYLDGYIKSGVIKGNFTREEALADLQIALWYAYACNNIDDYAYYYQSTMYLTAAEANARGCGTYYYRYAVALMHCGRLDDALRYAEQGAREEPDYPWVYLELGKLRAHFGDRDGALDAVAKGLALVPDDHEFLTLEREIHAGATIEEMCYHWIDPDFDRELQEATAEGEELAPHPTVDATEDMYEKQRVIACIRVNEAGLAYFRQLFRPDPQDYEKNAPYCSFHYPVGDTQVQLVFRMNEAGLSKRDPAWLRTQKTRLDDGHWASRTDEQGTGVLTAVHFELDNSVTLVYQYPWQENPVYIPLDEDGNPKDEAEE